MKTIPLVALMLATITGITGCQTTGAFNPSAKTQIYETQYPTESALEIVSQESQKALLAQQTLTKYRQTYLNTLTARYADFENDNTMIDYIGKPQSALASLAIKYGFRFIEVGAVRDLPTVNFTKFYGTPEQILASIDTQIGNSADLSYDKERKTITLNYNNR